MSSCTLSEIDGALVATARAASGTLCDVDVRQRDAGDLRTFADVLPVDLLLLCGIFGNISTGDIRSTVAAVPSMLTAGGTVIWTRGWFAHDDLRPAIRRWIAEAGLEEVAFDGEPERYGVGVARLPADSARATMSLENVHLFRFIK